MERLNLIREQKEQLKKKILQLEGQNVSQNQLSQEAMAALQQRKAKLQHERLEHEKYRKIQQQYAKRKAQLERQKQLEKIRNQKRMIELQVGMKRIVLNGVQEKVKGINSDQLLTRAILENADGSSLAKLRATKSKQQIKNDFQEYLIKENIKKEKPKHYLYQLNEKRFELFQKKQELLMRQVLIKQILNNRDPETMENIDIMNCSKYELQKLLEQMQIDIEDYKHPLNSKLVIENYPKIEQTIKSNINQKKQQIQEDELRSDKLRAQKAQLKDWVKNFPNQAIPKQVNEILDSILINLVYDYEKRHFKLSKDEKNQKMNQLQRQYEQILFENEFYQLALQIVDNIVRKVHEEISYETAQQVYQLHDFAHQKTALSFDWIFSKSNYLDIIRIQEKRLGIIQLDFTFQGDDVKYGKNEKKTLDKPNKDNKLQQNVFETQNFTSQLINDIKLLTSEEQFFNQVSIQIKRQVIQAIDQNDFKINNENGLYVISPKNIKLIAQQKDISRNIFTFEKQLKNIRNIKKLNNLWIIQTNDTIYVHSQWNLECLPVPIGQRINSPCGSFTNVQIYPTFTLLGSLCTILIGFQKGQLMKYNFNRNRINSIQTNITHYVPLGPAIKTGDQAAFPLSNRNLIEFKTEKPKQGDLIHEFRQFFDFHTMEIISVCYYKQNTFITVDKSLNCAIWIYDMRRGIKSYEPFYTFKIKSDYKTYKQSQNARFRDLYPSSSIPQSGQELYKKWMENQTYLKLQIYNNPKKNTAYFRSPKWDNEKDQQPIWKFNYDEKSQKVLKIFQTYYHSVDGKIQCRQVKLWKEYVIFLVQRQHTMRSDLKTVKIFVWSIEEKKLRTVAIQFDTFQEQRAFSFEIIQTKIQANQFPLIATISSAKILLFSMVSGQLLKDISEEKSCSKIKNYNFSSVEKGFLDNFYGITRRSIVEFMIQNKNSKQKKIQFNKIIDITRKKYNNLI